MFYQLAERALELERQGRKIIRLNIGNTNLPAPKCAIEAACAWLKKGSDGYSSSAGMHELRQAIAEREHCPVQNVVVGPGSKELIFGLLSVLGAKGRKVAFPSPYWPAYGLICDQLGFRKRILGSDLEGEWEPKGMTLMKGEIGLVCNPLNPTSTVYSEDFMESLLEQAKRAGAPLIIDEAYRGLAFKSIPQYDAIRVRSFSKEFNMEGWRLGYAIAPKEVAEKLVSFNQITSTCAPQFVQMAGLACLEDEAEILKSNRAEWKKRAEVAERALAKRGFSFSKPESGIYVFAAHAKIRDSDKYAMELLENGVAVAPGDSFGKYPGFVRICLNQDATALEQAISRM